MLMTHNPGFLDDDEIVAGFITREAELEALLDVLGENRGPTNQHVLIIGRRGMGKTMLINRLAVEIRRTPELSQRWVPVVFGEEAYNVATAGELWLEALFHVAEQTGEPRWHATYQALLDEQDDERLCVAALGRLLDFADEQGRRLLIVVENLQDILGVQMSDDEGWRLRHTLLNEPRIMLLATATNRFDDIDKPKKAAYELFRILELDRLDTNECREVWRHITGEELAGREIRPVEIFTGGNLRLVTVLAQFAAGRSFRNFTRELLGLLDDHSDYFKSNIEALPLDERRVFAALCDLWEPAFARDVARHARFNVNKTSMLLGRLERRGAIETVGKQGRAKQYEVSERLYNLYHLVRRRGSRDARVSGLIEFMVRYYSPERLQESARWIAEEACGLDVGSRRDNVIALAALVDRLGVATDGGSLVKGLPAEFWSLPEVGEQPVLMRAWEAERAFAVLEIVLKLSHDVSTAPEFAVDSTVEGLMAGYVGDLISAEQFSSKLEQVAGSVPRTAAHLVVVGVALRDVSVARQAASVLARSIRNLVLFEPFVALFAATILSDRRAIEQLVRWAFKAVPDWPILLFHIICTALVERKVPMLDLAFEVDERMRRTFPEEVSPQSHHIALALHHEGPEAALEILRTLVDQKAIHIPFGSRQVLLDLAALKPAQIRELLSQIPDAAPLTVALAMDLGLPYNAPRELVEVAKDVLEDIRDRRKTPRYDVHIPQPA
jgi:hypothetical protein